MAAVYTQTFNVAPAIDLSNLEARGVWDLLTDAWGEEFELARRDERNSLAAQNKTVIAQYYSVLTRSARTYSIHREFVDVASANQFKTWMDANISPTLLNFTRTESTVVDNQTLQGQGEVTLN